MLSLGVVNVKANGREPKSCAGLVFNFKIDCFNPEHGQNCVDTRPRPELKTLPRFCPDR